MEKKDFEIREIKPGEKPELYEAARESFPLIMYVFMRLLLLTESPLILVADDGEKLAGGVILTTVSRGNNIMGMIDYIFVRPEAAGQGLGPGLVDAGIDYFHANDVQEIMALVDGYNSPSWKMFYRKSFRKLSMIQQFRIWGVRTPLIWLKSFHFFSLGHFILWRDQEDHPEPPGIGRKEKFLEIASVLVIISIFGWLTMGLQNIEMIWVLLAVVINFTIYEGLEWIGIRGQGFKPEFRIWEQGITFNIIIGILGGYLPAYGSTYLQDNEFNHLKQPRIKGKTSFVVAVGGFLLTMMFLLGDMLLQAGAFSIMARISLTFYFWQFIVIVSPFDMFKGKRIFLWNRKIWLIVLAGFLIMLLVYF